MDPDINKRLEIERAFLKLFQENGIDTWLILFTTCLNRYKTGVLSVTFLTDSSMERGKELLRVDESLCDKSGVEYFPDKKTILISGTGLLRLIRDKLS